MIFIIISILLDLATAELQCTGILPPGLDKLRKGVDVTTVDILPLNIAASQGFKASVIEYTCQGKRQWRNPINKETYQIPDEIEMTSLPGGVMNNHVELHDTASSVARTRAASMGLGFLSGMFSGSGSKKTMTESITNRSMIIADVSAFHSAFRADMAPYWFLNISRYARLFIDRRFSDNYESNPAPFAEFIRYFGTHYFIFGKFGGLVRDYMEIKQSLLNTMTEQQIKVEAGASFLKMVKANAGYEGTTRSSSHQFDSSTQHFVKYYGGNANFFGEPREAWQRWENSVPGNPWLFAGHLAPITDLIQNEKKKLAFGAAVTEHINRGFLNEAEAYYNSLLIKTSDTSAHNLLLQQIRLIGQLKSLPLGKLKPDNAALLSINIGRPSWFLHNTRLCYQWYPDGDGGQCGGGAANNLCAKVNSMTAWYRDDTDRRSGGCRMKWGILSDGYANTDSWFSSVQLCFEWQPDGDGGQCGEGAPRRTCASVGSFTAVYRDDTDRRPGGCQMRWKMTIPDNAPLWIRMARLCYEWYPDGDGGQCGGGVERQLCAVVNQWTTYYRDDTDGRDGGCQMRWGILI